MPTNITGIRKSLLNTVVTRIRPVFTAGWGGNLVELPADVGKQQFLARVQEKKLKSMGHVGEELHPEGLVNRKLIVVDCNYTTMMGSNTNVDVILGDRLTYYTAQGQLISGRVVTLHDAAGAKIYQTFTLEWDGPLGDGGVGATN